MAMHSDTDTAERRVAGDVRHADLGADVHVDAGAIVGYVYGPDTNPTRIGDGATIRSGTVIYTDVVVGTGFTTGHGALVREETTVGDSVLLGTGSVLDGAVAVGSDVSIQTNVYVPTNATIGDRVFLGPNAVLTNDPYPLRRDVGLEGPVLEDDVTIGANATVLPGVTVGRRSFVAAGALVKDDVPPDTLVLGVPGTHRALPEHLAEDNRRR